MRVVIQRSGHSWVKVNNETVGEISSGLVLLVCFEKNDSLEVIEKSAQKILNLRCFEDPDTFKMNRDIKQVNGSILAISQFTLSWDGKKGNRPGFDNSMEPTLAKDYFLKLCERLKREVPVETGVFGESMQVNIVNQGPVTFNLVF